MTQTRNRYLFKNKGYFVYNYKLKKYEHMNDVDFKKKCQKCRFCYCVFEIKKAFKERQDICKLCFELLQMKDIKDAITPKIYVFGMKIKIIEFVQTFIVHLQIQYLEKKILEIKKVKYEKKLLVFI